MNSCFPPQFIRPLGLLLLGLILAGSHGVLAQAPPPIMDLSVAGNAEISDTSKFERKLKTPPLEPGAEKGVVFFPSNTAVTIPFNEQDPLFAQGPWTWMIRCKAKHAQSSDEGYLLAGRWEGRGDRRIVMLSFARKSGLPSLQVSSAGGLDERSLVKLKSQVPENVWVTIVGRFEPGVEMAIQLFDEKGELLDNAAISSGVPGVLADFPLPFIIGRGEPSDMEFARFRAWNSALSDEDIKTLAAEK